MSLLRGGVEMSPQRVQCPPDLALDRSERGVHVGRDFLMRQPAKERKRDHLALRCGQCCHRGVNGVPRFERLQEVEGAFSLRGGVAGW